MLYNSGVIELVISNHLPDYSLNCTPLSPFTITYCPHFMPEEMVKFQRKATGHFVTLIEIGMHLIMCISGHNCHLDEGLMLETEALKSFHSGNFTLINLFHTNFHVSLSHQPTAPQFLLKPNLCTFCFGSVHFTTALNC